MSKPNLLLVDGDPKSRQVLEVSLRKAGFFVSSYESAENGKAHLGKARPDAILADSALADGDGLAFCETVKSDDESSDIPFILLTKDQERETRVRGIELGADEVLMRPLFVREVIARIRMLLNRRNRERLTRDGRAFTGALVDMTVVDIIQMMELGEKSGVVYLTAAGDQRGAIYFRDGNVIDAELRQLQGETALYRLLLWSDGDFDVEFKTVRRRAVIKLSNQQLLQQGMQVVDEWQSLLEQLPPIDAVFEVDYSELRDRLGDIPDEMNAIVRVIDGRRTLLEVVDDSGFGQVEALKAIARLFFEGLIFDAAEETKLSQKPNARDRRRATQFFTGSLGDERPLEDALGGEREDFELSGVTPREPLVDESSVPPDTLSGIGPDAEAGDAAAEDTSEDLEPPASEIVYSSDGNAVSGAIDGSKRRSSSSVPAEGEAPEEGFGDEKLHASMEADREQVLAEQPADTTPAEEPAESEPVESEPEQQADAPTETKSASKQSRKRKRNRKRKKRQTAQRTSGAPTNTGPSKAAETSEPEATSQDDAANQAANDAADEAAADDGLSSEESEIDLWISSEDHEQLPAEVIPFPRKASLDVVTSANDDDDDTSEFDKPKTAAPVIYGGDYIDDGIDEPPRRPGGKGRWALTLIVLVGAGFGIYAFITSPTVGDGPKNLAVDTQGSNALPDPPRLTSAGGTASADASSTAAAADSGVTTTDAAVAQADSASQADSGSAADTAPAVVAVPAKPDSGPSAVAAKPDAGPAIAATPDTGPAVTPAPSAGEGYAELVKQGKALMAKRKRRQAAKLFKKALASNAEGWEAMEQLALYALDRGKMKQALKLARRAEAINADAPYIQLVLGSAAHEKGRKTEAKKAYQRFLQLCPTCRYAKDIRNVLKSM